MFSTFIQKGFRDVIKIPAPLCIFKLKILSSLAILTFFNFEYIFCFLINVKCYLIFHTQKVATHCKEQNKKRIMTIG